MLDNYVNNISTLTHKQLLLHAVEQKRELINNNKKLREPIAIIGMGCRFPSCESLETYWEFLKNRGNAINEIPPYKWDLRDYYNASQSAPGKSYSKWGAFLDNLEKFDAKLFGISPRECRNIDPQQRLLLETSWEAFESAGYKQEDLKGSQTGVFAGVSGADFFHLQNEFSDIRKINPHTITGASNSVAAGRISYTFGLRGPCLAIDTACSSSLVAIHLAIQSLRNSESDLALACAVNIIINPKLYILLSKAQMLSPTGLCRAFDSSADGYVRGEGCGAILLKRLSEATKDGDNILAILKGTATNHDGRGAGLTAPNSEAQRRVILAAIKDASVSPDDIDYVEAHGTGTEIGDPIEFNALSSIFGQNGKRNKPLLIGSVKTNLGHLETAAGMAGLLKVVLSLKNNSIPPHIHLDSVNPLIELEKIPAIIPTSQIEWIKRDTPRLAGVSAFGFSGTNAHIIVEEAPTQPQKALEIPEVGIVTLSGMSEKVLKDQATQLNNYLQKKRSITLNDLSYTYNTGRNKFHYRAALPFSDLKDLIQKLQNVASGKMLSEVNRDHFPDKDHIQVGFLFSGQGAQYSQMGKGLYERFPFFRNNIHICDDILKPITGVSLVSLMFSKDAGTTLADRTDLVQPALFALEYSLAKLWESWGICPSLVMGHSVGEYSASCYAGVFDLESGLRLIAKRGQLMAELPQKGTMASVFANKDHVENIIASYHEHVDIAAINSDNNTVISGQVSVIEDILDNLTHQGIHYQKLKVANAFHSSIMNPILEPFKEFSSQFSYNQPRIPLISNITGEQVNHSRNSHLYWSDHIRKPVLFKKGMEEFDRSGCNIIIEIGPNSTLLSLARRCLHKDNVIFLPSITEKKSEYERILQSLGEIFLTGKEIDWDSFYKESQARRISLPTYPFDRKYHWYKEPSEKSHNFLSTRRIDPLLDERVRSAKMKETVFQTSFDEHNPSYLIDHKLEGQIVIPSTVYLAMAYNAYEESNKIAAHTLKNIRFINPILLNEEIPVTTQIVLSQHEEDETSFEIYYRKISETDAETIQWRCDVQGCIIPIDKTEGMQPISISQHRLKFETAKDVDVFYQDLHDRGYHYGSLFKGIKELYITKNKLFSRIELPPSIEFQKSDSPLHPVLLDCCFHSVGILFKDKTNQVYIPISIEKLTIHQFHKKLIWCYCKSSQLSNRDQSFIEASIELYDENGFPVAEIEKVCFKAIQNKSIHDIPVKDVNESLHEICWIRDSNFTYDLENKNSIKNTLQRHWVIFSDQGGLGKKLKKDFEKREEQCTLIFAGDSYGKNKKGDFLIDPKNKTGFDKIFQDLCAEVGRFYGIVFLWNLDLKEMEPVKSVIESSRSLLYLVQSLSNKTHLTQIRLWLVSQGAETVKSSLEKINLPQTHISGFSQTIGIECPWLNCTRIDLDSRDRDSEKWLFYELINQDEETIVAYRKGSRYLARLSSIFSHQIIPFADVDPTGLRPVQLKIPLQGEIDNLEYHRLIRKPPKRGEVEVRVLATGLNFRDVVNALGLYPDGDFPLGGECAGRIVALGEGVNNFNIDDEVLVLANGSFSSYVTCRAEAVRTKPKNCSFEEAAAIPIAFLTAYYCLYYLGKISKNKKVLIHAAAGGVGLAAVQIAKFFGSEIYATVGNPDKRAFLKGIGITHIYDSRSLDFADEILQVTKNEGVDIVLNSLPGDFIPKGLIALGKHGVFLEIGKRGIWDEKQVAQFNDKIEYHTIALDKLLKDEPSNILALLDDILGQFSKDNFKPLPITIFPIQETKQAFRYMSQTRNIGKVIISQKDQPNNKSTTASGIRSVVPNASYLITGGLGGLGVVFAEWIVNQGGRSIYLMGRNVPSTTAECKIEELKEKGATVHILQGDVTRFSDVQKAINIINSKKHPLRGVFHAAGIVENNLLTTETWENFEAVLRPKVAGGWFLHELTKHLDLDFFVLFSSGAAMLGSPGQSNYATANAFLNGLASYRVSQGKNAISINWGPWSDVGMGAEKLVKYKKQLSERGITHLSPTFAMKAYEISNNYSVSNLGVFLIDWNTFTQNLPKEVLPFFKTVRPSEINRKTKIGHLKEVLLNSSPIDRNEILINYLRNKIANVLQMSSPNEINTRHSLMELGLDSLMAVEIVNDVQLALDTTIPQTILLDYSTVEQLTQYLLNKHLKLSTGINSVEDETATTQIDTADIPGTLEEINNDALSELLEDELSSIDNILED